MTHLHGGFVDDDSDGNPAVTPDGFGRDTQTVFYTNQQPQMPASLLWFHDHGLGATRLNVSAGLAAAYVLRDQYDTGTEPNPIGIPGGAYEIPLVVQDRQFNPDGTFLYPTSDIAGATWIGEYFGDVMLVNGKVWPFLEVEPRMYRFRILNGCNARILNLDIGGPSLWHRRRGRHVGPARAGQAAGARPGRAGRPARRLRHGRPAIPSWSKTTSRPSRSPPRRRNWSR
jgi:spore coat protein A